MTTEETACAARGSVPPCRAYGERSTRTHHILANGARAAPGAVATAFALLTSTDRSRFGLGSGVLPPPSLPGQPIEPNRRGALIRDQLLCRTESLDPVTERWCSRPSAARRNCTSIRRYGPLDGLWPSSSTHVSTRSRLNRRRRNGSSRDPTKRMKNDLDFENGTEREGDHPDPPMTSAPLALSARPRYGTSILPRFPCRGDSSCRGRTVHRVVRLWAIRSGVSHDHTK